MNIINDVLVDKLFKDPPKRTKEIPLLSEKTASGDGMVIINDAYSDFPITNLTLRGKSEQVTTTGKNLFDYKDFVDINTYIDNTGSYRRKYLQLKPNTAYRVTIFKNRMTPDGDTTVMFIGDKETYDNTSANGIIAFFTSNEKKSATITTKESGQIVFKLKANSTPELQEEYLSQADIIFSEGTTEIPYEPYTGGKPSPSPEYPQEIKSVGKWNPETQKYEVGVRVTGNNILNMQIEPDTKGIYQGWKVGDGKKKITLSIIDKGNNKDISNCYFGLSGNGTDQKDGVAWLIESGKITKTKTTSLIPYVTIFPSDETAQRKILERFDIQCEFGEIQTEYQPYKEQNLTLTSDRPITKWDKLVEKGGVWGWVFQSKRSVLNEKSVWDTGGKEQIDKGNYYFVTVINDASGENQTSVCKTLKNVNFTYGNGNIGTYGTYCDHVNLGAGHKFFRQPNESIRTLDEWKAWLAENPIEILYKTKESEFVPLPQDEQNAIRALKTYYPTTVITVDGGELPVGIEVTYMHPEYIPTKQSALRMWFKENPII